MDSIKPILDGAGKIEQKTLKDKTVSELSEKKMQEAAQKFEASFISQMLKHGGLADALVANGGQQVEAFTTFYIDQLSNKIAEDGGFGLAENIYAQLKKYESEEG